MPPRSRQLALVGSMLFAVVDDVAEGSSPLTVRALARRIADDLACGCAAPNAAADS